MGAQKRTKVRIKRREKRVRNKLISRGKKPRVSVFRSLSYIYAQIIDDRNGTTLVSYSSRNVKDTIRDKKAMAKHVGAELGKLAKERSITEVFFDRGRYPYHGRVAALADGLRGEGIKF